MNFGCTVFCAWAFSTCGEWGLLFVVASLAVEHRCSRAWACNCGAWA